MLPVLWRKATGKDGLGNPLTNIYLNKIEHLLMKIIKSHFVNWVKKIPVYHYRNAMNKSLWYFVVTRKHCYFNESQYFCFLCLLHLWVHLGGNRHPLLGCIRTYETCTLPCFLSAKCRAMLIAWKGNNQNKAKQLCVCKQPSTRYRPSSSTVSLCLNRYSTSLICCLYIFQVICGITRGGGIYSVI